MGIRSLRLLTITGLLAVLVGCQSVRTTQGGAVGVDRQQHMFTLLSEKEVDAMSKASYKEMRQSASKEKRLVTEGKPLKRLQTIADRLVAQVGVFRKDASQWPWQVSLIDNEQLNASALPGGRIVFYTGIIDKLELTDDEIAAIMGHEIAHALREHGREAISEAYMVQLSTGLAGALLGATKETMDLGHQLVHYALTLPNSREKESEADVIGLELMARAGYNPNAAVSLWKKMAAQSGERPPEFMSTHPATDTRIKDLKHYIPRVEGFYRVAGGS